MEGKPVVPASVALRRVSDPPSASEPETPTKPRWRFVKTFGAADPIRFADGTQFKFRLIKASDGSGFLPTSQADVNDEELARRLREAAKNPALGLAEVKL